MTRFALWGETEHAEESLWAECEEVEHLFAPAWPPPTPPPVRYELLGCAPEGDLARAVAETAVRGSAPLAPFTLVWHDHEAARRSLGVSPQEPRPESFEELLGFLRARRVEILLA